MAGENKIVSQGGDQDYSKKFTAIILQEFKAGGKIKISEKEAELIRRYFIGIDNSLKIAEEKRVAKNKRNSDKKYDNNLSFTWNNIDIQDLAGRIVDCAKLGLDMALKNHVNAIPYKNKTTQKYDITMMRGYCGQQVVAEKYALEKPKNVITELIYSTDRFTIIKRDQKNKVEGYTFEITEPLNRGDIVGGFGYIEFKNKEKNKIIVMSLAQILKRKPQYAAPEFWGGKKKITKWVDNQKTDVWVEIEGWKDEMYLKTLKREVYSEKNILLDPAKVDAVYQSLQMRESRDAELMTQAEIEENANKTIIDAESVPETPAPEQDHPPGKEVKKEEPAGNGADY